MAPNDHLRDFESNRRHNWLKRIDQHVKEYFQLCCSHDVSVPARGVVMTALESFERALKESISNVLEGFDGVDKLSYEQSSGVFNFIQRH